MNFLLRLFSFLFFVTNILNTFASPTRHLCRPDQRNALVEFESEFEIRNLDVDVFSNPKTKSWTNKSDCCSWDGVKCDAKSGEVVELDLSCSCFHGKLRPTSSLFKLQELRVLNLAYNELGSSEIPSQLGTLTELKVLNLSNSWTSGPIPKELLHLTKLVSLDLSSNSLSADKSFLINLSQNLTNLEDLNLELVDISSEIPQSISNLSSLKSLSLDDCSLFGNFPSNLLMIPTLQSIKLHGNQDMEGYLPEFNENNSLVFLDLSWISISGNIPDSISNLKHLNTLKLKFCNLHGVIPSSLGNLTNLSALHLSHNNFNGQIPSSFGNLSCLTSIDLSSNRLDGQIPPSFVNLKQLTTLQLGSNKLTGNFPFALLNLTNLSALSLSDNHFTGALPPNISALCNMETFEASQNVFTGTLPSSLFNIPSLTCVDLQDNQLNHILEFGNKSSPSKLERLLIGINHFRGSIPLSISRLVNLYLLDLSYFNTGTAVDFGIFSQLKGIIDLDISYINTTNAVDLSIIFLHLNSLSTLYLAGVHVSTKKMGLVSNPPTNLCLLRLSGCGITEFPKFVRKLQQMSRLDISNNKIRGQVPRWIWKLRMLTFLNLSSNAFTGLERSSNDSTRLEISMLDMSSNALQGPFIDPPVSMESMLVSNNKFTGKIPQSICERRSLQQLDLSNNNFTGSIPQCLENLDTSLSVLNLRYNQLSGNIPEIFTNATELVSLDVSHNRFVGKLPRSLKSCSKLEVLNVGGNAIDDTFPFWLNALPELKVMVLRNNEFKGLLHRPPPPHSFGFPKLQIIDVSKIASMEHYHHITLQTGT